MKKKGVVGEKKNEVEKGKEEAWENTSEKECENEIKNKKNTNWGNWHVNKRRQRRKWMIKKGF